MLRVRVLIGIKGNFLEDGGLMVGLSFFFWLLWEKDIVLW